MELGRTLVLVLVLSGAVCAAVAAHSAAEMGLSPDQYDLGIPVYWPFHAILMTGGFLLLLSGIIVIHYRLTKNPLRSHRILQSAGGVVFIAGLATSVAMVSLSGAPHLRYLHDILGAVTVTLILVTMLAGFSIRRHRAIPPIHRWLGRVSLILVVANILLGISMMTMVLAQ